MVSDEIDPNLHYLTLSVSLVILGRPMEINIVGATDNRPQSARFQSNGRNQRSGFRNNNQSQNFKQNNQSRNGKAQQQQQQRQNGKKDDVTADDLDADLEAYRAESKQKK